MLRSTAKLSAVVRDSEEERTGDTQGGGWRPLEAPKADAQCPLLSHPQPGPASVTVAPQLTLPTRVSCRGLCCLEFKSQLGHLLAA